MPPPLGASEVHIKEDIRLIMRALLATHESTLRLTPATAVTDAYSRGFREATLLLAEALNVNLGIPSARQYMDR